MQERIDNLNLSQQKKKNIFFWFRHCLLVFGIQKKFNHLIYIKRLGT